MAVKTVSQPRQKRSIATKKKIKVAARKLFARSGYYTITSNMIAAEAKVPIGSFYNYFGNKKVLILELIQEWNAEYHKHTFQKFPIILEALQSSNDILPTMSKLLENSILSDKLSDPFYKVFHSLQFTEPDILDLSEKIRHTEIELLYEYLERISKFCPIDNIPVKAKLIHSSGENIGLYIHHLGTDFEKKQLVNETAKMLYAYCVLDSDV